MLTLYDYLPSQNAYKVRLLLALLQRPYETRLIRIFEGEGQTETYRAVSPTGAVPAIRLADGRCLAESNAILLFLAEGSRYLPDDAYCRARVQQWLFFEADYVQAGIATLRHWVLTGKADRRNPDLVAQKRALSERTLGILDRELARNPFLGGADYTVADISVFAYTHRAEEAGLDLSAYPNVCKWITRIQMQDRHLSTVHPYSIDPHSGREL